MSTNRQVFGNYLVTRGAHLRSPARINLHNCSASIFRFAKTELYKLIPSGICNALIHASEVPLSHGLNVQLLKSNKLVFVYQASRQLVCKVSSAVSDAMINMLACPPALFLFRTALYRFVSFAIGFGKFLFIFTEESRIVNLLAVGECSKVRKSNVNAHNLIGSRKRIRLYNARETGVPMAECISPDGEGFGSSSQRAMQLDFNDADFREAQVFIVNESPVAINLRIGEGIVSIGGFESWITWLLARFNTAEECAEGKINAGLSILEHLRMGLLKPRILLFPDWKEFVGVVSAERFFTFLPRIASCFKGFVINPTAGIKHLLQRRLLCFCWV